MYSDGGVGASTTCVAMTMSSLRDAVTRGVGPPSIVVRTTTSEELVGTKWRAWCRLLVMPGGRDLPYCQDLNGEANRQISIFVEAGGGYLGICAGGYYGSAYVDFAGGDHTHKVLGPRELALFPVVARGPAFPWLGYQTNAGARAVEVGVAEAGGEVLGGVAKETLSLFYNGGCVFLPKEEGDQEYHVLLTYRGHDLLLPPDHTHTGHGTPDHTHHSEPLGMIGGRVGEGRVILSGLHIEASVVSLQECFHDDEHITALLPALQISEQRRQQIFDSCINYLLHHTKTSTMPS